jgi:hypothetical protein
MKMASLTRQQDINATTQAQFHTNTMTSDAGITLLLERCPSSLARVFALLCTMTLIPTSSCCAEIGEDIVRLDLFFESVRTDRYDLLLRKLALLIECQEMTSSSPQETRQQATTG